MPWYGGKARRLATIAKAINESQTRYVARVEKSFSNTDRPKPAGLRYRVHVGKGRSGNKLIVVDMKGRKVRRGLLGLVRPVVLEHDASESYSMNYEVEEWVAKNIPKAANPEYLT